MQFLYSLLVLLCSPLIGIGFLCSRKGRKALQERFGVWNIKDTQSKWIWFHAASLGEVTALEQVIRRTKEKYESKKTAVKILVTVTSFAAVERAKAYADQVRLLPFDSCFFYHLAARKLKITSVIFTETEIWPALLGYLSARKINIFWVNARMMPTSYRYYRRLKFFFSKVFLQIDAIAAQTETDADCFRSCGAPFVTVQGNTKYDIATHSVPRQHIPTDVHSKPVVSVTNIRPEEENIIFPAITDTLEKLLVFIIPRHQESFSYFKEQLIKWMIPFQSIEEYKTAPCSQGVVLVDAFGLLEQLVSQSKGVIAAGSFYPQYKGHNLLTAAAYSVPVCTGIYNDSSKPVMEELSRHHAIKVARGTEDLRSFLADVASGADELCRIGENAHRYLLQHQGAADRVVHWIIEESLQNGATKYASGKTWVRQIASCIFLYPLSLILKGISSFRNLLFDLNIFRQYRSTKKVISVGNLTVGGTGKTPLVISLVKDLAQKGYRSAIVTRGYKGSEKGPFLIDEFNRASLTAQMVGDEPLEMFDALQCPVVVAKNRAKGVQLVEQKNLADMIFLDDGFQHRWVSRDYNIVCVDVSCIESVRKFIEERVLPYGIFRESKDKALKRIDKVVFSTRQLKDVTARSSVWIKTLQTLFPDISVSASHYSHVCLIDYAGTELPISNVAGKKAFIFCAIGNPEGFLNTVKMLPLHIHHPVMTAPDHHFFTQKELLQIEEALSENDIVITTGKDFRRLPASLQQKVHWLKAETIIEPDLIAALPLEEPPAIFS